MFWADVVAEELKKRNKLLEWVDDMKTPSGRIHIGALRGVVVHDLVFKALKEKGINTKYTYVFDNHDPMDGLPVYLPKEFEQYLGLPLFKVPSPQKGFENFAEFYALEFKRVFNAIGCDPEIIWSTDLYTSGKMNNAIRSCLDKADVIRGIYEGMYKKKLPKNWYPFNVYCQKCEKVATTTVTDWDGNEVSYACEVDKVKWTKGCGHTGKISPFSSADRTNGKLPWKVEWAAKWQVLGITVEGAGKDHMSRGGSHDLASLVSQRVLNYEVPYPVGYEWFLIGGRKMSTSKGVGSTAIEMLDMLPPELLRFLMVKTDKNRQINFDPDGETIPKLFDDFQKAAEAYFEKADDDLARIFELSQISSIRKPPTVRFTTLAQWVQMPDMEEEIKKQGLEEWAKYARVWVEKYAPDSERFTVEKEVPETARKLSPAQKGLLKKIANELEKYQDPEIFQKDIYEWAKEIGLSSKEAFSAIYQSLIGKDHGPKAGWLILSLDKEFVKKRFDEVVKSVDSKQEANEGKITPFTNEGVFYIDNKVKEKYPSISIGVALIKGVNIEKTNENLEEEKNTLLSSLENLTTEQLGQYPEIIAYRNLYKAMGIDWHSRRPSPEALLRRVALKKGLYNVNTCVDAYNLIVIKRRISVGAFDSDALSFPTAMRFPKEGEDILLLGDSEPTKYKETELAYFDQKGGFNIDFNYRDAQRTAVQLPTKNLYINVDGIYDISPQKVEEALKETCDIITKYCGGKIEDFGVATP